MHAVDEDSNGEDWVKEAQETRGRCSNSQVESGIHYHNSVRQTQACFTHTMLIHTHHTAYNVERYCKNCSKYSVCTYGAVPCSNTFMAVARAKFPPAESPTSTMCSPVVPGREL